MVGDVRHGLGASLGSSCACSALAVPSHKKFPGTLSNAGEWLNEGEALETDLRTRVRLEIRVSHIAVLPDIEALVLLFSGDPDSKDSFDDQPEHQ